MTAPLDVEQTAAGAMHPAPCIAALLAVAGLVACGGARAEGDRRVIVLGMDGLDYTLVRELIDAGRLPNFKRLEQSGGFSPLETAASPQSPVAWSNFITGLDSGGHGIFDFLHRDLSDPLPFGMPYQATSKAPPRGRILRFSGLLPHWEESEMSGRSLEIGGWVLPLWGAEGTQLARHGTPFWQRLAEHGIRSSVLRMPANYPPVGVAERELSGMGTPDLRGTSGSFTFYSTDRRQFLKRDVTGGEIYPADVVDNVFNGTIYGPADNPVTAEPDDELTTEFIVYLDAENPAAKFEVGSTQFILRQGEWSDWTAVEFELLPWVQSLPGMVRFYLKSVRPQFELYITPVQIDPLEPAMPISVPESFATELARSSGRFYTQEMPEDTKAIVHGVFDIDDFLSQAHITGQEVIRQYRQVLRSWNNDFLFYYFGNADQVSHVLWGWTLDPGHPGHVADLHDRYRDAIPQIYEELDAVIGTTLEHIELDTTLIVMSDHGFTSWRREFHLNTWLYEHGYLRLARGNRLPVKEFFQGVAWPRTRAYGLGISGLYLNLEGRERNGVVKPGERDALLERIERELLATIDPATGMPAITKVYIRERDFHDRGHIEIGPDIIVGYAKGTRGSGNDALGGIPQEVIDDNLDDWSGDHIMDHRTVPGILLSNRPLARPATSLQNLGAAILAEFGIGGFPDGSQPITVQEN